MKKKLLTVLTGVVCAAAVVGGVAAVSQHYDKYQNKQKHDTQNAVTVAKTAQYKTDKSQFDLLAKQYATVQAECQKGAVAYGLLTTQVLKAKVGTAPVCAAATTAQ